MGSAVAGSATKSRSKEPEAGEPEDIPEAVAAPEGKRPRPAEWNAGTHPWIIDVIVPFGGADKVIAEVKKGVFNGEKIKALQPAPDGSGFAVVEW